MMTDMHDETCECNTMPSFSPQDYKSDVKPVWCPGCGDYGVISAIYRALSELDLPPKDVALVSGIGCSSRIAAYAATYGFHGLHGRALPLAAGLKLARPDMTVLVAGGDGDGFSIGGNHFLHACRRNVEMTYIVMDNAVYGMTKGQASPTSEADWCGSKLTPEGPCIPPIQPLEVALCAQASFVARAFSGNPGELVRQIVAGIRHKGFSFINVLSPCITYCPEQKNYRELVHPAWEKPEKDRLKALERLMKDDGFGTGILFQEDRPPYTPLSRKAVSLDNIEQAFRL